MLCGKTSAVGVASTSPEPKMGSHPPKNSSLCTGTPKSCQLPLSILPSLFSFAKCILAIFYWVWGLEFGDLHGFPPPNFTNKMLAEGKITLSSSIG